MLKRYAAVRRRHEIGKGFTVDRVLIYCVGKLIKQIPIKIFRNDYL